MTISLPSSDLAKSWRGECDGHTWGYLGRVGRGGGGAPYRLVFIRAHAPPVAVCLVYKWRENLMGIVER